MSDSSTPSSPEPTSRSAADPALPEGVARPGVVDDLLDDPSGAVGGRLVAEIPLATPAAEAEAEATLAAVDSDDYWYGDETDALTSEYRGAGDDEDGGRRPFRFTFKLLAFAAITYYFVVPLIPNFRTAWEQLRTVNPFLLLAGFGLENIALWCYAPLMHTALGDAGDKITQSRLYRIQMSTRALQSIIPGGSAASSALGYRLMTLSGVAGPDAGFALATVGLGSALVLNLILWVGLVISIPIRGVNPIYGTAAMVGIILMGIAATIVYGLMEGQGRSERIIRWIARKLRFDPDRAALVLHRVAERLEQLISDRQLLGRVVFWAALNWLFDAAALWVFLRAFGITMGPDALIIAFGIANVMAAIPITPGGLGYVDLGMIGMLVGFGAPRAQVALGVPAYRFAQLFLPIIVGGILYLSLRVGPWSIERRDRLVKLRELADDATRHRESRVDFQLRIPSTRRLEPHEQRRERDRSRQVRIPKRSQPDAGPDGEPDLTEQ